ncbi:MAG: adenylate/guanylate cyclase domain-containing protein [Myxococcaceae bacterium]
MKTPLLSVQTRILIAFVSLTLISIAVVTWQGYRSARAALTEAAERELVGLERAKSQQVGTILSTTRRQVTALSGVPLFVEAARDLRSAYREISGNAVTPAMKQAVEQFYLRDFDPALSRRSAIAPPPGAFIPRNAGALYLQYHYVVPAGAAYDGAGVLASTTDAGPYAAALSRHSRQLRGALERLGMDSIALVDPETMEVFYSYRQSTLLGTSLRDGPYAESNLAAMVRNLRETKDVDDYRVSDFEAWRPSLGSPMAWVGSPVFDGPKIIAVMVQRFRLRPIAQALSDGGKWTGLGKSGEVYLLGGDGTMRTDSRFLLEDRAAFLETLRHSTLTTRTAETVERLNTTILTVPVRHAAAQAALRGQSGVMELDDYRGVPVFMAYGPVDLDSVRWAVIAKIDRGEAMAPLTAYLQRMLATAVVLAFLASLASLLLASVLTRPITALVSAAQEVSAGRLDVQVPLHRIHEYRKLGEAFNAMVKSLGASRSALDRKIEENEQLLDSLLPASGAAQVRGGAGDRPQAFADVTVAYIRLVGLEALSQKTGEEASMTLLSDLVAAFDEAADQHGVEKVRTIGSSYLAASGLSVERPDHTARMVEFAREVVRIVGRFNTDRQAHLTAEIGINTGPVIAGLVGRRRFIYDLWGDTVKIAREIESGGKTSILVTRAVYDRVNDSVPFGPAVRHALRGAGTLELYPVHFEVAAAA